MHIKNSNKAQKTNIRKLLDDMEISNQKDVLVADVKVGTLSVGELYGDFELFTGTGLKPYQATVVRYNRFWNSTLFLFSEASRLLYIC